MTSEELKEELLMIADDNGSPFAVIIRKMRGMLDAQENPEELQQMFTGGAAALPSIYAVKVLMDGTEIPILPVSVVNFVPEGYRDIAGASEGRTHHNMMDMGSFNPMSALISLMSGNIGSASQVNFISVITPDLLFEDLTIRSAVSGKQRMPVVPHPLASD